MYVCTKHRPNESLNNVQCITMQRINSKHIFTVSTLLSSQPNRYLLLLSNIFHQPRNILPCSK